MVMVFKALHPAFDRQRSCLVSVASSSGVLALLQRAPSRMSLSPVSFVLSNPWSFQTRHPSLLTLSGIFIPLSSEVECIGVLGVGSKIVCDLSCVIDKPDCVIYSVDVSHESSFIPRRPPAADQAVNTPCSFEAELLERGKLPGLGSVDVMRHFLSGQPETSPDSPSHNLVQR